MLAQQRAQVGHRPQALGAFTPVVVLAGNGATVLPARRASRLNVLDAVQYE